MKARDPRDIALDVRAGKIKLKDLDVKIVPGVRQVLRRDAALVQYARDKATTPPGARLRREVVQAGRG